MTIVLGDRIRQTTVTTGDGNIVLSGTPKSFQSFASVLNSGDNTYYCIENGGNFEVGIGTYGINGPNTLSRDTILSSSTGSKLDLSGKSFVFVTVPAAKTVHLSTSGIFGLDFNLNYLSDVAITSPVSGDILYHNGTEFVNLGAGTAVFKNVGTSSGNIPLIGSGNKISASLIPALTGVVTSIAGRNGDVTLTTSDITNIGSIATQSAGNVSISGGLITNITDLSINDGGTGASSASGARINLGLGTMATQNSNSVTITGGTITGLPSPTASTQAATKSYVDTFLTGLRDFKESCRLASTSALTLSGLQIIDGVQTNANDRILVKNNGVASQNGIYLAKSTSWTRSTDTDSSAEITAGMYTYVEAGTTNAGTSWVLSTTGNITLGTTPLTFIKFNEQALPLVASNNLSDVPIPASGRKNLGLEIGVDVAAQNHTHSGVYYTIAQSDAAYQAQNYNLTAISQLASTGNTLPYFTGSGTAALTPFTSQARVFNSASTQSDQRDAIGLGSIAIYNSGDFAQSSHNHNDLYQPLNSGLTSISALNTQSFGRSLLTQDSASGTRSLIGAGTSSFDGAFSSLSGVPTTISGYGITDALPLSGGTLTGKLITAASTSGSVGFCIPIASGISSLPSTGDMYVSSDGTSLWIYLNGAFRNIANLTTAQTWSSVQTFLTSGSGNQSIVIPHGITPASPTNGGIWSTTNGLFMQINGTTEQFSTLTNAVTLTNKTISGSSNTLSNIANSSLLNSTVSINGSAISLGSGISGLATIASGLDQFASTTSSNLASVISDETGSGSLVFANSPTLITPNLGTPSSLVGTNISGTGSNFTANAVLNPGLTGHITTSGTVASLGSFTLSQLNAAISDADVMSQVSSTGIDTFTSGSGNYTVPAGVSSIEVRIKGQGGNGADGDSNGGGGGGGGGYGTKILSVTPGDLIAYVVGSGAASTVTYSGITYTVNKGANAVFGTGGSGGTCTVSGGGSFTTSATGQAGANNSSDAGGKGGNNGDGTLGGNGGSTAGINGSNGGIGAGGGGGGELAFAGTGGRANIDFVYSSSASYVSGPSSSIDSQLALFSGTTGQLLKTYSGTGIVLVTSGVVSTVTAPTGTIVGDTDTQTLSGKTISGSNNTLSNIANSSLSNSTISINGSTIPLGSGITGIATIASGLNQFASTTSSQLAGIISDETGSGSLVFANSPTLITPNLGTPSTLVGTNISGTGSNFTAGYVQNPGLTGHVTTSGTVASLGSFTLSQLNTAISDGDVGDVFGPSSSTDNAIARFDLTTGKLIQNSVSTISDSGMLDTLAATLDYIQLDTLATPPTISEGTIAWNGSDGTADLGLKGGNITLKIGEQRYTRVYNDAGTTLTKGNVVYISGAQGNRVAVKLAVASGELTSKDTIGFVAETITGGSEGWIINDGSLYNIATTGLTAGDTVYLSPTIAGTYTTTKPSGPNHTVVLGFVQRVHAAAGSIFVKVNNGYEIDELHNVSAQSPSNGNILIYNSASGVWQAANLTDGNSINITEGNGSITIAVSDGDKGDISVTGSGATWTIDNDAVTYAKIQNVSETDKILGRSSSGAGDIEEITCTSLARSILSQETASGVRSTIGAGTSSFDGAYSSLSGIPSTFTPSSHVHGNITDAGAIGSTANLPLITTTAGVITVGSFGTTASTFCEGNDSRLSDARTPTAHNQAWSTITSTPTTLSGYGITDALTAATAESTYLALAGGTLTGALSITDTSTISGVVYCGINLTGNGAGRIFSIQGNTPYWHVRQSTGLFSKLSPLSLSFGSTGTSEDVSLARSDANALRQINGTNAQTFEICETFTSDTSFGSLRLKATASGHQIGSALGSAGGANRAVQVGHFNSDETFTSAISVATNGVATFAQAPVISTISNTGTLTLPTSTDTLVGRATTDTLTNKTLTSPVISTISNVGTITIPSSTTTLVGRDTTDTLTNKRTQRRISVNTSATGITPDISSFDFYEYTALATGITISNPTGTPVNGELMNFRFQDNGTGRTLTWGAQFRSLTATLPTTTVANKTHRVLCEWNSGDSTWDCLAVSAQP